MAQEEKGSPNLLFNELIIGEKKKVREKPFSLSGFVRDDGTIRFLSGSLTVGRTHKAGYKVLLMNQTVHRLVALAFVKNPRPDIFNLVDHINHDKANNHFTNLRWLDTELNAANRKDSKNVIYVKRMKTKKWAGVFKVGKKRFRKMFETEAEATKWAHREKAAAWEKLYDEKISQTRS